MPRHRSAKSILDLPQQNETWFVALHQMRAWVDSEAGEPFRPWVVIVVVTDTGMVQHVATLETRPNEKTLSALLFKAIKERSPVLPSNPHRPQAIWIEDEAIARSLVSEFSDFAIKVAYTPRPAGFEDFIKDFEQSLGGESIPGLLSIKGITVELGGQFFAAAANFYDASPWDLLTDADPLKIEVNGDKRKRIVVVMGGGGIEYGLSVYDAWQDYLRMIENADDLEKAISAKGAHALNFNDVTETPFDDMEAAEKYGWKLNKDELYPVPIIVNLRQESVKRPPLADIEWYEAVLQAIPIFVDEHLEEDEESGEWLPIEATIAVTTTKGSRAVKISYPAGEIPDRLLRAPDPQLASGDMTDFRSFMENMLGNLGLSLGGKKEISAQVDEAQQLMYEAWEERNPAKRITKAKQALKISPDCADAYVLLAQEASKTNQEMLHNYELGVAAGERALGQQFFKENAGHFWGLIETRPYMRAREGLANVLWSLGRHAEASQHFSELLRLNPGDNQGVRYSLLNLFLANNQNDAASALLKQFKEDGMAEWAYSKALLAFRKGGNAAAANKLLGEAIKQNQYVPAFLTGKKRLPAQPPETIGFGDENEAISYAGGNLKNWRNTPGAIEWLKSSAK